VRGIHGLNGRHHRLHRQQRPVPDFLSKYLQAEESQRQAFQPRPELPDRDVSLKPRPHRWKLRDSIWTTAFQAELHDACCLVLQRPVSEDQFGEASRQLQPHSTCQLAIQPGFLGCWSDRGLGQLARPEAARAPVRGDEPIQQGCVTPCQPFYRVDLRVWTWPWVHLQVLKLGHIPGQ